MNYRQQYTPDKNAVQKSVSIPSATASLLIPGEEWALHGHQGLGED